MIASFDFSIPSEDLCGREDVAVQSRHFAARISMASRWRLCRCRYDLGWEEVVESHCGVGQGEKRQFLCFGGCWYLLSIIEHDRKQLSMIKWDTLKGCLAFLAGHWLCHCLRTWHKGQVWSPEDDLGKLCWSNQQTFKVTLGTSTP